MRKEDANQERQRAARAASDKPDPRREPDYRTRSRGETERIAEKLRAEGRSYVVVDRRGNVISAFQAPPPVQTGRAYGSAPLDGPPTNTGASVPPLAPSYGVTTGETLANGSNLLPVTLESLDGLNPTYQVDPEFNVEHVGPLYQTLTRPDGTLAAVPVGPDLDEVLTGALIAATPAMQSIAGAVTGFDPSLRIELDIPSREEQRRVSREALNQNMETTWDEMVSP